MTDRETWEQAQKGEINHHSDNFDLNDKNKSHYHEIYRKVFKFADPTFTFDVNDKSVMEIGPGVFAALLYCSNVNKKSYIVEPLPMPENVVKQYDGSPIEFLNGTVEDLDLPSVDEVWVFNVMQHIWNPDLFVKKLKRSAKKIVFFEPINTPLDGLHIHSYSLEDFKKFFGESCVNQYNGGSEANFHTANCAYGIWDKEKEKENNVSVIGIGKLGLCLALSLEKSGFSVVGVDISQKYVDTINSKKYDTEEPYVSEYLKTSVNFEATTELKTAVDHAKTLFVIVATPSMKNGRYDHSQIDSVAHKLIEFGKQETEKHLVICCTTMPGYCDSLQEKLNAYNWQVSYNPEFIAQGTVIQNQENPDMILIGEANEKLGNEIELIYKRMVKNKPRFNRMDRLSAEITKIGLNCFLVTKIAYANMIGDLARSVGADHEKILGAIGDDTRIGRKFLGYGFGYGGTCLPRDARAFGIFANESGCYSDIPIAADKSNELHLVKQVELFIKENPEKKEVEFDYVTFKKESILLEESQQLKFAVELANAGYPVTIEERDVVITELKKKYKNLFTYKQKKKFKGKRVISFTLFGDKDFYLFGAIQNAKDAKFYYPGWECRFYVDSDIRQSIKDELRRYGANVIEKTPGLGYAALFWRFEPIHEKDVELWISRDVDSRFSLRETKAVEEWIESDKTFHVMRDSHNHDLYQIMAGMFGVKNTLCHIKYPQISFGSVGNINAQDCDQVMLQTQVWSYFENDHVCHDHWAHNVPTTDNLTQMNGRNPKTTYNGQGVFGHVSNRRINYPNQFSKGSINLPYPNTEQPKYGLYLGQKIKEDNTPVWNEEVQWEYELRGIKW